MNDKARQLRPRIYYNPGDVVIIKHDITDKPRMIVEKAEKMQNPDGEKAGLLGVSCFWFDKNHVLHKHRFNTKDLKKIAKDD